MRALTIEEQWIDIVDRDLYRMMHQCPESKKYTELYMALQHARSVSMSMLPEEHQKYLRKMGENRAI